MYVEEMNSNDKDQKQYNFKMYFLMFLSQSIARKRVANNGTKNIEDRRQSKK